MTAIICDTFYFVHIVSLNTIVVSQWVRDYSNDFAGEETEPQGE